MKADEAKRLLILLKVIGHSFIEDQPDDTPAAQAARMGMQLLLNHLERELDFRELASQEPNEGEVLRRADSFCREHCPCSRVGPPGEHELCQGCPLMPVTVGLESARVNDAMEGTT